MDLTSTTITVESKVFNPPEEILIKYGTIQQTVARTLFNYLINNEITNKTSQILEKEYSRKFKVNVRIFRVNYLHYLKNKLNKLKQKTYKLKAIWGTKGFYESQWNLTKEQKQTWLQEWKRKRNHRIYSVGSKDEKFRNGNCQLINLKTLTITLPEEIGIWRTNLQVNFDKDKRNYDLLKQAISNKQALTYRIFQAENKDWYCQISFKISNECPCQTRAIVIDMNYNLITTCLVKNDGNPEQFCSYRPELDKQTSNENTETLINIINNIVTRAKENKAHIVIEDLDLTMKKEDNGKVGFITYNKFFKLLKTKAIKEGVLVQTVNPAYTSIISKLKYAKELGRSIHECAALVIGRRGLKYRERIPCRLACELDGREKHKHHWSQWSLLSRRLKTVLCRRDRDSVKGW